MYLTTSHYFLHYVSYVFKYFILLLCIITFNIDYCYMYVLLLHTPSHVWPEFNKLLSIVRSLKIRNSQKFEHAKITRSTVVKYNIICVIPCNVSHAWLDVCLTLCWAVTGDLASYLTASESHKLPYRPQGRI